MHKRWKERREREKDEQMGQSARVIFVGEYELNSNPPCAPLVYGFNKVNDMIHSNLKNENQTWEFRHPHFRQGCIDDLRNIKRKSVRSLRATAPLPPSSAMDQDNKADMYHREYNMIEDRLNYIVRGHNAMQEEFSSLRFVVARQQEVSGYTAHSCYSSASSMNSAKIQIIMHIARLLKSWSLFSKTLTGLYQRLIPNLLPVSSKQTPLLQKLHYTCVTNTNFYFLKVTPNPMMTSKYADLRKSKCVCACVRNGTRKETLTKARIAF